MASLGAVASAVAAWIAIATSCPLVIALQRSLLVPFLVTSALLLTSSLNCDLYVIYSRSFSES